MRREPDLKVADAAKELSISERFAWELIREGELQSYKVGRLRRIPRESVDAYKARHAVITKGAA